MWPLWGVLALAYPRGYFSFALIHLLVYLFLPYHVKGLLPAVLLPCSYEIPLRLSLAYGGTWLPFWFHSSPIF